MTTVPPAVVEVVIDHGGPDGPRWLLRSSDRLFSGVFVNPASPERNTGADPHPGHAVILRDGRAG